MACQRTWHNVAGRQPFAVADLAVERPWRSRGNGCRGAFSSRAAAAFK